MQKSLQILGCQALSDGSPQPLRRENDFGTVGQLPEMFSNEGFRPESVLGPVTSSTRCICSW